MARRKPAATTRKPKVRARPGVRPIPSSVVAPGDDRPPVEVQTTLGESTSDEPQALVVSHWFDSGQTGEPYAATIRLTGRRLGVHGQPRAGDTFAQDDKVEGIIPGSGAISVTSTVYGLQRGGWTVTADLIRPTEHAAQPADRWRRQTSERLPRAKWSWLRRRLTDGDANAVPTRWALIAPLARIPAVIPGSFTLLGTFAIATAVTVISMVLARDGVPIADSLLVSILALISGLVGAKLWYAVLHPGSWRYAFGGWSVDGFLVVAPVVAMGALVTLHLSIGSYFNAAAPAIFLAVAIGRFGCFFTGCCAGRCTASRWGVWSSDRRIGARRIPAQLLESAVGLSIALVSLGLVASRFGSGSGEVFLVAIAAYFIARQFLLRARAERREFSWRRSPLVSRERS